MRDRARRAAETSEQRSEKAKRGHARYTAQTASERQATSQWKSTRQRRAATPEERETRNGSSAIWHFERGDEDLTEFLHRTATHTYPHPFIHRCPFTAQERLDSTVLKKRHVTRELLI